MPSSKYEYYTVGLDPQVMLAIDRVVQRRKESDKQYSKRELIERQVVRDKDVAAELKIIKQNGGGAK